MIARADSTLRLILILLLVLVTPVLLVVAAELAGMR
jgi:hypothetical protein